MKPPLVFSIFLFMIVNGLAAEKTYDDGFEPKPPSSFPSAYKNYQILPGTFSPDGKFALIYPKRSILYELDQPHLFAAQLKPFRVVTEIPLRYSNLARNAHGSYAVDWAKDSSAVVVVEGRKWGPDRVFLVPVNGTRNVKLVDLTAEVEKQVRPDFEQARAEHYNDMLEFIFDSDPPDTWRISNGNVVIECTCTTDPKGLEEHSWTVRFKGTWDITSGRFIQHEVIRTPQRPNQSMKPTQHFVVSSG
jgi:hypothetical protein